MVSGKSVRVRSKVASQRLAGGSGRPFVFLGSDSGLLAIHRPEGQFRMDLEDARLQTRAL